MVAGPLLRNGQTIQTWNLDAYGYGLGSPNLYQSHPWVLAVRGDGSAYGVLADTAHRCTIDTTKSITFTCPLSFPVIIIDRPSPQEVIEELAKLTGYMPLPPKWALGYHQSKFSYFPASNVLDIAKTFRANKIPCDAIWMDIDYMDDYRIFSFSPEGLNATKRRRELVTMVGYASPVGGESTLNLAGGALPVNFSKYGSSSLKMTTEELPAGEYTLGRTYGPAVFCFGVDSDELHTEKEGTMRSIPPRVIGAITAIATFRADTSLGTWKYNAAKSRSTSTNPIESRTDLREATSDGSVKLTSTEHRADGTSILSFTCKYDGREYPVTGGAYDTISVKRVYSDTTSFKVRKSGGTYHLTGRNVVSKGGKTLTQISKGTDAEGKPVTQTLVFDKQ
jgi:hypothetical protein